MHQELPGAKGVLVENIPLLIGADMHPDDLHLSVFDQAEGILQVHIALTDGFDLGTGQRDARFIAVLDKIIMERLAVFGRSAWCLSDPRASPPVGCFLSAVSIL